MWFKKKKKVRDKSPTKSKYMSQFHGELKNVDMKDEINIDNTNSILQSHDKDEQSIDSSEEYIGNSGTDEYNHENEEDEEDEENEEDEEEASYSSSSSSDSGESIDSNHEGMDDNDFMRRLLTNDPTLTEIDISIESNDYDTCNEFAKALMMNFHVNILHLTGSNNAVRMKIFKTIIAAVAKNTSIAALELKRATIDRQMAVELGMCLGSCKSLQTLKLTNCVFKESALAVLFLGMQHCATLQEIIINSCDFGGNSLDFVAATLSLMKIKSLTLNNGNITTEGIKFLCKSIAQNSHLEELNLSRNSLTIYDARSIASCLASSEQNIKSLSLGSCTLDDECIQILSNSFLQSKKIEKICLSRNDITGKGALALIRVLEKNTSIIELDVDGCKISSRKRLAIVDALRCNNSFLKSFCSNEVSITILDAVDMICGDVVNKHK